MVFMKYEGPAGMGFTQGRVYEAQDEVGRTGAVSSRVKVVDDDGEVRFVSHKDGFVFPQEVFAVWMRDAPDGTALAGDVVMVDGADDDTYHIDGNGRAMKRLLKVLDRTMLLDVRVLDSRDSYWKKVRSVDDADWISVEGAEGEMRPITEFGFAVSDGGLLSRPVIKCVKTVREGGLTSGKLYELLWSDAGDVIVKNDDGEWARCPKGHFSK